MYKGGELEPPKDFLPRSTESTDRRAALILSSRPFNNIEMAIGLRPIRSICREHQWQQVSQHSCHVRDFDGFALTAYVTW